MLKEAFEWIVDHAAKADISEINGEMYSDRELVKVAKPKRLAIEVTTLTGLVDFIKSEFDGQEKLLITVDSHNRVSVKTKVNNNQERETTLLLKRNYHKLSLTASLI